LKKDKPSKKDPMGQKTHGLSERRWIYLGRCCRQAFISDDEMTGKQLSAYEYQWPKSHLPERGRNTKQFF
jgi:hypothetical protein